MLEAVIHDTGHEEIEDDEAQPSVVIPPTSQAEGDFKAREMV